MSNFSFRHRPHQRESKMPPFFINRRVHHQVYHLQVSGVITSNSDHALDESFGRVLSVAQSLYRCYLSCKEAFPSHHSKGEWVAAAWSEACSRTGIYPSRSPCEKE